MTFSYRLVAIFVAVLFFGVETTRAVQPTAFPVFELTALDGHIVKSADLGAPQHWLLVYVQSNQQFSDRLLRLLKKEDYPQLATRAVIVVLGPSEEARIMKQNYPELAQAAWYADPSRNAFDQLKLRGVPVILGVNKQTVEWNLNGVLPDVNTQKAILNSWLQE